jgi:hypothetical protein
MRGTWTILILGAAAALGIAAPASAAPVLRVAAGANAAAIQSAVDQFRADLGGGDNGTGGAFLGGRREIDWDDVPDDKAEPNALPYDFFNSTRPRGAIFESVGNIGAQHQFRVSSALGNPSGAAVRFGNVDVSYATTFTTFSPERLFAARSANTIDVFFYVPGTSIPATVSGFGAVFADVDSSATYIEYFDIAGKKLSGISLNVANNGLSFSGTSFNAGERIARVQMTLGKNPLAAGSVDGTAGVDVVALDDLIYGEPQADPGSIRLADAKLTGAESGSATVTVVRTGRGPASVTLKTADGTAKAGSDYTPFSGTLAFGLDETAKTVTIPLAKDTATEGDESFDVALSNAQGGALTDPSSATVTIVDRPPPPPPATTPVVLPAPIVADRTPPTLVLGRLAARTTRAAFLRGVSVSITPSEPSTLTVELLGTTGRATLAAAGDLTLASKALPLAGGKRTVKLKPSRKLVARAHKRFTARLRVTATDASGNRTVVTRRVVVR